MHQPDVATLSDFAVVSWWGDSESQATASIGRKAAASTNVMPVLESIPKQEILVLIQLLNL